MRFVKIIIQRHELILFLIKQVIRSYSLDYYISKHLESIFYA